MSCSCHISPPCGYCVRSFECGGCGKLRNQDEYGMTEVNESFYCDQCIETKVVVEFTPPPPAEDMPLSELYRKLDAAGGWYCERCKVEVKRLRCQHCGKLQGEER